MRVQWEDNAKILIQSLEFKRNLSTRRASRDLSSSQASRDLSSRRASRDLSSSQASCDLKSDHPVILRPYFCFKPPLSVH